MHDRFGVSSTEAVFYFILDMAVSHERIAHPALHLGKLEPMQDAARRLRVPASAKDRAEFGGVDVLRGADARLPVAILLLTQGDGTVHALDLCAESGDVIQIVLVQPESLDHGAGDRDEHAVVIGEEVHALQELALHHNAALRFSTEVTLVRRSVVDAGRHKLGGYTVRLLRRVGKGEAAGIGGDGDIERERDLGRELAKRDGDLIDNLAAGGTLRVDTAARAEQAAVGVVVDGEAYAVEFAPKEGYCWPDGTHDPFVLNWLIAKAEPAAPVLTPAAVTLDAENKTVTFAVTRSGDGVVEAKSSDATVATATVSGATVTVKTPMTEKTGTVDIAVTVKEGTNFKAFTRGVACAVTANFDA